MTPRRSRRTSRGSRRWPSVRETLGDLDRFDLASLLGLGVLGWLVVTTFADYGVTWDEPFHVDYGDRILRYFTSGFADRAALAYPGGQQPTYGGAFDLLGALVRRLSPFGPHETMHLLGGLVGLLGIVGAHRLGRLLAGPAGGFWSALLLALTPAYYGTIFNNPKDPPFAVGMVWALYALAALGHELPHPRRRCWLAVALGLGAAMCVRVAGIVTIGYLLLLIVGYPLWRGRAAGGSGAGLRTFGRLAPRALAAAVGGWAIMIAAWPWAHQAPLRRPLSALAVVSDYNLFIGQRRFGDERIWTYDPPWDYLPRYFALQLPEMVLLAAGLGVAIAAVVVARRRPDPSAAGRMLGFGVVGISIVAPPAYAIARGSALYDGLRHFVFLTPAIAVVGGTALGWLTERLRQRSRRLGLAAIGVLAIAAVQQALVMRHLHPHEYVYFNAIAGGLSGAHERYDADYYGSSYGEAFACLERYLWQHERHAYLHRVHRLSGCVDRRAAEHYRAPHFEWVGFGRRKQADFFLAYRRDDCQRHGRGHEVICRVERFGVPLAEVYDLRH